uniref:Uncharacterized protein LOC113794059 n=1 Tax=Dermatophagoides pteronyssinus TaxID=6956 RepID=A0A6P6Y381_DERPT|nr:uncharacterized protein LOC113794059 [Dermatophagoides pteronyssinus]
MDQQESERKCSKRKLTNINVDLDVEYFDKIKKIFLIERYKPPPFETRIQSWLNGTIEISPEIDCEIYFTKDLIKIIDTIHDDLVGANRMFKHYIPDTEFRKIWWKILEIYPNPIRKRFDNFNFQIGSSRDPLISFLMDKVRNNNAKYNQRKRRASKKLTTTITVA